MKKCIFMVPLFMAMVMGAQAEVATFDDIVVAKADTVWQGADSPLAGANAWVNGDYSFLTYKDSSAWGCYYYDFTVSNEKSSVSSGYLEPYRSAAGGAYSGDNFAVWTNNFYSGNRITCASKTIEGTMLCNNAYTTHSMVEGDGWNNAFTAEDSLTLLLIGKQGGEVTDTLKVDLASRGSYISQWTWIDLRGLGEVDEIEIGMVGSQTGERGLNTPQYVCFDDFGCAMPAGYVVPEREKFPTSGVSAVSADEASKARKRMVGGQLVIEQGGKVYNALGQEMR